MGRGLVLAIALGWLPQAGAVSFDCAKAATAVERLLCSDKRLAAPDEALAERYAALLAVVPSAQRAQVRGAQQAWLARRGQCLADPDPGDCLERRIEAREKALDAEFALAAARLDAVVARIPSAPAAAAAQLRTYDGGLASAWLVYLHRFVPAAGVGASEARARFVAASATLRRLDPVAAGMLDTAEPADGHAAEARDLTLLRLWIERSGYRVDASTRADARAYAHCFVFARQGKPAYDAMGPLYGSSRDLDAPICAPQPGLFDQPAWKQLYQAFASLIEKASEEAGSMRYADFAGWRVISLQATQSPSLFLQRPQDAGPRRDPAAAIAGWRDAARWPQADRKAALSALQPARAATARWLVEHKAMPQAQAEQVAAAIVADWVEARIAFGEGATG
jgi:uncharacterized protein